MYEKLVSVLTNNSLVKGIKQSSPFSQTSCLEGFHSLLNQFAPKMIAYSYIGMYCRYIYTVLSFCLLLGSCTTTGALSNNFIQRPKHYFASLAIPNTILLFLFQAYPCNSTF